MSGNTLQYAETPDGLTALHAGTWHWLKDDERNASYDLGDTSVTTAWETCDLSGRVPPGTVAIFGYMNIRTTSANDSILLSLRPSGSAEASNPTTYTLAIAADIGASTNIQLGTLVFILAPNGIFQYSEHAAFTPVDSIYFTLWGYMI